MKISINQRGFSLALAFSLCIHVVSSFSQTVSIGGIVNIYAAATRIDTLLCPASLTVSSSSGFFQGDTIVLIQMKGADFDSSNTSAFGTVNNIRGAGNYEIARIANVTGNTFQLNGKLLKYYDVKGFVQVVKVRHYASATVASPLTCQAWNGSTGGVLVLSVANNLSLNASINVNGKGFRGGTISNNPDPFC